MRRYLWCSCLLVTACTATDVGTARRGEGSDMTSAREDSGAADATTGNGSEPSGGGNRGDASSGGQPGTDGGAGTDGGKPADMGCHAGPLLAAPNGVGFGAACSGGAMRLLPRARIAGAWVGGGKNGACTASDARVVCPAGDTGRVVAQLTGAELRVSFEADKDTQVEALSAEGDLTLEGARGFLSNGFQSWSQSGVVALAAAPSAQALNTALTAVGEAEVYRQGRELSWWYSFVGGGPLHLMAGVTSAEHFRSFVQVHKGPSTALTLRLVSGVTEKVSLKKGDTLAGENWRVELGADLHAILRRYGQALPTRRSAHRVATPAGWNSWYDLWDDVRESDIVASQGKRNADLATEVLGPRVPESARPLWVVVDDGWQVSWGDWEANTKFPSGLDGLAKAVAARGARLGVWLAPLLVDPDSKVAKAHPDWLVGNATYDHPGHGAMRILDVTKPEAAAHLTGVIRKLVGAGIKFLKIDFLFAGAWEGTRHESVTGMQAYRRALSIIRSAAGEDTVLVAVGAPPLTTFEFVDGWRLGNDIAFKPVPVINFPRPTWSFIANQARQLSARWPYCLATLCDADPPLLRDLPQDEVEAGAWVAVAAGGALFLSDDLTRLPEARRTWGLDAERIALGLSGTPATPESFYPSQLPELLKNMKDDNSLFNAEHQVPSVWRMGNGTRVAFNFLNASTTVEGVAIPPHAARVLAATP